MGQEEYRSCMTKNMGGGRLKGLSKEDRKIEFCTIAKQCSRGIPYEEAKQICLLPKEPKAPKSGRDGAKSCEKDVVKLTQCMIDYFEENGVYRHLLNINSVGSAIAICAEAASNPTATRGTKPKKCKIDTDNLAVCIIEALGDSEINKDFLATAIADCTGQKVEKPPTREGFIKKCFKENSFTGDIKEAQKLRSMCTAQWKEQEVASF